MILHRTSFPRRFVTPTITREVKFPTWAEIVSSQSVDAFADAAWARTLSLANPQTRQEIGFWITLDTCTATYGHTAPILGPPVASPDTGQVNIGRRPADIPASPPPAKGCATYAVASFHTHTPTTYRVPVTSSRRVGPSQHDENADRHDKVPGVVYDYYEAPPQGSGRIPFGYPLNAQAKRYQSGLLRRPTP